MPPSDSECSPWTPRTCRFSFSHNSYKKAVSDEKLGLKQIHTLNSFFLAVSFGNLMWTEARTVEPRLVGQNVSHPRRSSREKGTTFSMLWNRVTVAGDFESECIHGIFTLTPLINRSSTCPTSLPSCMEMIRMWSSSFTQIRNVLLLLWKIPRP